MPLRVSPRLPARCVAALGLSCACVAAAQLKPPAPPQPPDWKPGRHARAFAAGHAQIVREFVWGRKLEAAEGVLRVNTIDRTWGEDPASRDVLNAVAARVRVPAERAEYAIRFTALLPVGERRPTMGGVLVNHPIFGDTDLAGPGIYPRLRAYVAAWGRAEVRKNGKVIGRDRTALVWAGEAALGPEGNWLHTADRSRTTAHLVVFGSLGHGEPLSETADGFLHFVWPAAVVSAPGYPPRK